ncbi:TetR/AcrR family transcriptional regulator [Paenibacillus sp. H1-7]|uniref:TetR/AcrR family transcriptional regulator n=1 Tax=Paenibacillus sp. H1-7 TaxID=2282849 RepID=UPI001EF8ACBF|nr:TetR/AcrR family transcriptional regulator [Paenibacillus sp. H1-7]ULL16275.1 TetR/AcrR family transcriptional regulator [Paenibacillus sp. H1-7]
MKRNKEDTNATIRALLDVAREHFTVKGFAAASLEELANEAQLTRGALYHHFGSKKQLFIAVLESVQHEVAQRVEQDAAQSDDVWEQLLRGCRAFVSAAVEPRNKRIMLIDGPAVLGWEQWRSMDERNSMRLLYGQLEMMQNEGYIGNVSIDALTHTLSGALNESALWIAQTEDSERALEETMHVISLLLSGFKR